MAKNEKNFNKKAQVAGQVFIFILAAALAILIITYGYKAISGFTERTEQIAFVNLKTDLQNGVRTIAYDYGSVKKLELAMPGDFESICFLDLSYVGDKVNSCLCSFCSDKPQDLHPEVCDAWTTDGILDNVFLIPATPFQVSSIVIEETATGNNPGYICIPPRGGKAYLRLEGQGNHTKVWEWTI